ncbi:hypothetical protein C1I63_08940 [Rathayibacter caricis DSM 15933]|uniref:DUF559 domain-containing protein n=1 Tax=Rathayibacter caricis DSM 15933 TaxID=1328867 RepID=A0A2T4UTY0_9MICO|nr:hypothetical protein C1I63_08940 [Rathayibacter caricis DSM 15933]
MRCRRGSCSARSWRTGSSSSRRTTSCSSPATAVTTPTVRSRVAPTSRPLSRTSTVPARALRTALSRASDAAASRPETGLRLMIVEAGLPEPELNVPIRVGSKLLTVGDLVFARWKVLVEYDGEQHRTSDAQFARDRERLLALQLAGWIIVPIRAEGLRQGSARTIAEIRAALHAHGWRG